jgi:Fic family protein
LYWHKKLFESTKSDIAGKVRQHQVAIAGSKFMPPFPAEIYPLLREFFRWYNKNKNKLHPVELAALVHFNFVTIHPFTDGNGRISRLMMNFVLRKHEFPLLNIQYENRTSYYNALERAQIKKQDNIFVQWFFRRYIKEYERY